MPIYEFCCNKCKARFEELVRSGETGSAGVVCPECGSKKVKRMLSSFSFKSAGGTGPAAAGNAGGGCGSCSKTSCSTCG
ncbi:MAG: FmdB family zinc ribbon protein [Thermoleophilia bacterium]